MRILFLDAYYKPEKIAFTHLEEDLIEGFVTDGHEIDIICPIPTRGVDKAIYNKYKRIKYEEDYDGKVRIHRFWAPQEGTNPIIRAFRYIWCNIRTYQIGINFSDTSVIFANSTPPTQGWIAGKLKRKLKCKFIYSLQDIFPESLVTTGLGKKNALMYKLGNRIANYTYSAADIIVVISQSFKKNIMEKGVAESKIKVIYNWIDTAKIKPIEKKDNKLFDELRIPRNIFTVVYAGNFGASQNGQIIIEAAKLLEDYKIQFILFGGGSDYSIIKKRAKKISNIHCFNLMPLNRVSEVYSLGDVTLITCKKGTGNAGMPSKTWSIMACNTPIIASFDKDSDLAQMIIQSGAGVCVEPEHVEKLVNSILDVFHRLYHCKINSRDYVENCASKSICVQKYVDILKEDIFESN